MDQFQPHYSSLNKYGPVCTNYSPIPAGTSCGAIPWGAKPAGYARRGMQGATKSSNTVQILALQGIPDTLQCLFLTPYTDALW